MRKIQICQTVDQKITVRLEGNLVQGVSLDLKQVKAAKRAKQWTPILQDGYVKRITTRLADEGLRADEVQHVVTQLKTMLTEA